MSSPAASYKRRNCDKRTKPAVALREWYLKVIETYTMSYLPHVDKDVYLPTALKRLELESVQPLIVWKMLESLDPLGEVLLDWLNSLDAGDVSKVTKWAAILKPTTDHLLVEREHSGLRAVLEEAKGPCRHRGCISNHVADVALPEKVGADNYP